MPRRPAQHTQADWARIIRAAKQAGAGAVRYTSDGTIHVDLQPTNGAESQQNEIAEDDEVVL